MASPVPVVSRTWGQAVLNDREPSRPDAAFHFSGVAMENLATSGCRQASLRHRNFAAPQVSRYFGGTEVHGPPAARPDLGGAVRPPRRDGRRLQSTPGRPPRTGDFGAPGTRGRYLVVPHRRAQGAGDLAALSANLLHSCPAWEGQFGSCRSSATYIRNPLPSHPAVVCPSIPSTDRHEHSSKRKHKHHAHTSCSSNTRQYSVLTLTTPPPPHQPA